MLRCLIAAVLATMVATTAIAADPPKQIGWEDLMPEAEPIENPFDKMDLQLREDLGYVFRVKADLELGLIEANSPEMQEANRISARIKEEGFDVEALERQLDEIQAELDRRDTMVNRDLEGSVVRIPGYALPLEMNETGVTEFLLVPYVGACIHTPPPPPNQMVFVKLREEYEVTSLFDPVWITGQISVEQASRSLSFIDGTSDVATGYAINGVSVEPYE